MGQPSQEYLQRLAMVIMASPRNDFNAGYLSAITEIYRSTYSDSPRWLIEACAWYKAR